MIEPDQASKIVSVQAWKLRRIGVRLDEFELGPASYGEVPPGDSPDLIVRRPVWIGEGFRCRSHALFDGRAALGKLALHLGEGRLGQVGMARRMSPDLDTRPRDASKVAPAHQLEPRRPRSLTL